MYADKITKAMELTINETNRRREIQKEYNKINGIEPQQISKVIDNQLLINRPKNQEIDDVLENDPGYFSWIMKSDFPNYTKKILSQLRLNKLNNKLQ